MTATNPAKRGPNSVAGRHEGLARPATSGSLGGGNVKPKPSGSTSRREHGGPTPSTSNSATPGAWRTQDGGWTDAKVIGTNNKTPGQHG